MTTLRIVRIVDQGSLDRPISNLQEEVVVVADRFEVAGGPALRSKFLRLTDGARPNCGGDGRTKLRCEGFVESSPKGPATCVSADMTAASRRRVSRNGLGYSWGFSLHAFSRWLRIASPTSSKR